MENPMKLRRFAAAALVATSVFVAAPVANAQPAPEPLGQVLREIEARVGWEAQNIILVPAALSAVGSSMNILSSIIQAALGKN